MKVGYPISGFNFVSKDALPASCTSKPQITCTAQPHEVKGYTNKELYEGLVNMSNKVKTIFGEKDKQAQQINYIA